MTKNRLKYSREMFGFPGIFAILALSFEGGFSSPPRKSNFIY